jgi:peroxiredoxin
MPKVKLNVQAPAFTMDDYQGQPLDITTFQGKKNVLLVFNRGFK